MYGWFTPLEATERPSYMMAAGGGQVDRDARKKKSEDDTFPKDEPAGKFV